MHTVIGWMLHTRLDPCVPRWSVSQGLRFSSPSPHPNSWVPSNVANFLTEIWSARLAPPWVGGGGGGEGDGDSVGSCVCWRFLRVSGWFWVSLGNWYINYSPPLFGARMAKFTSLSIWQLALCGTTYSFICIASFPWPVLHTHMCTWLMWNLCVFTAEDREQEPSHKFFGQGAGVAIKL